MSTSRMSDFFSGGIGLLWFVQTCGQHMSNLDPFNPFNPFNPLNPFNPFNPYHHLPSDKHGMLENGPFISDFPSWKPPFSRDFPASHV